ncbi:hypothetical protein Taro_002437 [Colocasia esculenta]|uniref:Uncharacterized protein n=1 Tax=Colocasia esculenta TaxID=4460 RepID=A0A843TNR6_COLES|nr:hypothetical protein [Colocasia esculenta]
MFREGLALSWGREEQAWGAGGEKNGWGNRGSSSNSRCIDLGYCISCIRPKVVMRILWNPMRLGKSDEHRSYEEMKDYE